MMPPLQRRKPLGPDAHRAGGAGLELESLESRVARAAGSPLVRGGLTIIAGIVTGNVLGFARATQNWTDNDNNGMNALVALTPSQFDHALRSVREDYPPQATAAMLDLLDSHDTNRALYVLTLSGDTGLVQAKEIIVGQQNAVRSKGEKLGNLCLDPGSGKQRHQVRAQGRGDPSPLGEGLQAWALDLATPRLDENQNVLGHDDHFPR